MLEQSKNDIAVFFCNNILIFESEAHTRSDNDYKKYLKIIIIIMRDRIYV